MRRCRAAAAVGAAIAPTDAVLTGLEAQSAVRGLTSVRLHEAGEIDDEVLRRLPDHLDAEEVQATRRRSTFGPATGGPNPAESR